MLSKKILFLEINSSYSHSMLSYGMIRAYVEDQLPQYQWSHVEATLKYPLSDIADEVAGNNPDIVLASCYIFNCRVLLNCCALIKKMLPESLIVLGGPVFLGNNESFLLDNRQINGVVRGDESSVPQLLQSLSDRVEHVPGYCWINSDGVYCDNGIALFAADLDCLPSPFQAGLINNNKPFCQIETSRGCNGNCQFCTSSETGRVKYFSLERCRSDLLAIRDAGINEVRLIDRTFNEQSDRATALLEMFREDFPKMKFHLEINPAKLNSRVVEGLTRAPVGQLHVEVGVQSLNPDVLKKVMRPASVQATVNGLNILLGIKRFEIHADLIAGLPGQTLQSVLYDIEQLMHIGPNEIQLEVLKLLQGTALRRDLPEGYMFNPEPLWEVTETPDMTAEDFSQAAKYSHIIDSWYNAPRIHKCWRFAYNNIPDMFKTFCAFVNDKITCNSGKLELEKRFLILEEFCRNKSLYATQLCRFFMVAHGFAHPEFKTVKADNQKLTDCKSIWHLPEKHQARRYIFMECSFNAGDFFANPQSEFIQGKYIYIFKLFYGRNVVEILQK